MGTLVRRQLINASTGDGQTGTPIDNLEWQDLQANIEAEFFTSNHPTTTTRSIIDNLMAGIPFDALGDPNWSSGDLAYPAGGTPDKLVAGSKVFRVDTAHMQEGNYQFEAMLNTIVQPDGSPTDAELLPAVALVDLADPNTVITELVGELNGPGPILMRSPNIAWPAAFVLRDFGFKIRGRGGQAYGIRIIRVG